MKNVIAALFLAVIFVLPGLFSPFYPTKLSEVAAEKSREFFREQGRSEVKVLGQDYSIGQIEMCVAVEQEEYYLVFGDFTPPIVRFTTLNFFLSPNLELRHVAKMEGGT